MHGHLLRGETPPWCSDCQIELTVELCFIFECRLTFNNWFYPKKWTFRKIWVHVFTRISIILTIIFTICIILCLSYASICRLFIYVDLVSLQSFLTCLLCFISTVLGKNSLNSDVNNKLNKQTPLIHLTLNLCTFSKLCTSSDLFGQVFLPYIKYIACTQALYTSPFTFRNTPVEVNIEAMSSKHSM